MKMVRSEKLIYEYEKRDEEGNVIGMNRAVDGVDIDIAPGDFVAILGHNGYANFLVFEFILYYNMHKEDAGRKMYGISENQFPVSP